MKAILAGCAAIVVISFTAYFVLGQAGFSSEEVYSGSSVRLD